MLLKDSNGDLATAVKVGTNRQVVIPKRIYHAIGLAAGDYVEVTIRSGSVVMTPKTLVDKPPAGRLSNDQKSTL